MSDILYEAALNYKELLNKEFYIVVGRKCKTYEIYLKFNMESFFHLIGLQHLTDIRHTSTNRERIFKDILEKKITIEKIQKSVFYNEFYIEERIIYLKYLEEMIDSCRFVFLIKHNEYLRYTRIYADYLCQFQLTQEKNDYLYFFSVKKSTRKSENEYIGCSFFKKHDIDYTRGTCEAKLLLNIKIEKGIDNSVIKRELYRHKNYLEIFE